MKIRYTALLLTLTAGSVSAAEITVSAAASLKEAFADIAAKYEKQYPQSKVKLNTAGSGALLQCGVADFHVVLSGFLTLNGISFVTHRTPFDDGHF